MEDMLIEIKKNNLAVYGIKDTENAIFSRWQESGAPAQSAGFDTGCREFFAHPLFVSATGAIFRPEGVRT